MKARERRWALKRRPGDLMRVLRRPVEQATINLLYSTSFVGPESAEAGNSRSGDNETLLFKA